MFARRRKFNTPIPPPDVSESVENGRLVPVESEEEPWGEYHDGDDTVVQQRDAGEGNRGLWIAAVKVVARVWRRRR